MTLNQNKNWKDYEIDMLRFMIVVCDLSFSKAARCFFTTRNSIASACARYNIKSEKSRKKAYIVAATRYKNILKHA